MQTRIHPRKFDKILWDIEVQTNDQILIRRLLIHKKRSGHLMDFIVSEDYNMKMKDKKQTWILPES